MVFRLFWRLIGMRSDEKYYFDAKYYLSAYSDVKSAGVDPYTHFATHGWREGRNPSADFDTLFYKDRNLGGCLSENPLQHYALHRNETDLRIFPESERDLLEVQRRVIGPEFDEGFYSRRFSVPIESALDHYLTIGWRAGYEPNCSFSTEDYLKAHPHILVSKVNPFYHFVSTRTQSCEQRRSGSVEPVAAAPKTKYVSTMKKPLFVDGDRAAEIAAIAPEFESEFYLRTNSDVAASGNHPLLHFVDYGWKEGRNPSRLFWTKYYLAKYRDVADSNVNPFFHYITKGRAEGRKPNPIGSAFWPSLVAPPAEAWDFLSGAKSVADALVDVIVPVYDGYAETFAAIHAVLANAQRVPFELVVVNDRSPDSRITEELRRLAARDLFTYLENEVNLGFVGTVNRGLTLHPDRDVILLNSDAIVHGDWIDRLLFHADKDEKVATITPFSNNATICSYPLPNQDNYVALEVTVGDLDDFAKVANAYRSSDVPTGVGFCFYMRRKIICEIGVLDRDAFARGYGEENDYCMRALKAGYRNIFAHDVVVYHAGEVSFADCASAGKAAGMRALRGKHPDYPARIELYQRADIAHEARMRLDLYRVAKQVGTKSALMITQAHGGGVATHVERHVERLKAEGYETVVLKVGNGSGGADVQFVHDESIFTPTLGGMTIDKHGEILADFIAWMRPEFIHVHSFAGLEWHCTAALMDIIEKSGRDYYCTAHDYSSVCHRTNFVTPDGRYCGAPTLEVCADCLASDSECRQYIPPPVRRAVYRAFFAQAKGVFTPSADAAARLKQLTPGVEFLVRPHEDHLRAPERRAVAPASSSPLRVAVLGALGPHKGSRVLHALALDAEIRKLPIEFTVIGYTNIQGMMDSVGVTQTGEYGDDDTAVEKLIELAPHLTLFPSIWPETYCYTLSLALIAGVPPVVFDIGAPAERLRTLGSGHILDFTLVDEPSQVNDALLQLDLDRLWTNMPALAPHLYHTLTADYYGLGNESSSKKLSSQNEKVAGLKERRNR
ncbi:glycosyltransferase [Methylosinus sp. RM1]|uniref:glycosyltransferase n=1 Tax=Methylosinus sp. RM1 TaxID=2583817 RepID=UPI001407BA03